LLALSEADAVVSLCAGDSFSDIYGYGQFIAVCVSDLAAILLHRPLVYFPQTIGPFSTRSTKVLARFLLSRAFLVFTRERFSTETVQQLLPKGRQALERADMAFLMASQDPALHLSVDDRPLIGINVSGFMHFAPTFKHLAPGFDYPVFMRQVIETFVRRHAARVWLIPHDYQLVGEDADDLLACRAVFATLDDDVKAQVRLVEELYTAPQLKAIIGQVDFFVGARLHACIGALSMRVPVIPLAYSYKFRGIMQGVGLGDCICDPRSQTPEQMLDKMQQGFRERAALRSALEAALPSVEAKVASCSDMVLHHLGVRCISAFGPPGIHPFIAETDRAPGDTR
jgi:polysaccharide pyruvyl transferase WcaK-like protein